MGFGLSVLSACKQLVVRVFHDFLYENSILSWIVAPSFLVSDAYSFWVSGQ